MVLAAHTLKQIQHLQAIDKGPSSPSHKIKQNSSKNYKIPQSLASIPFFAPIKSEHLTEKYKFPWFSSSTQSTQKMKK